MGEHRIRAVGLGRTTGEGLVPPDLTDVDLRTLRALDDPELIAAVEGVLANPEELRRVWYTNPDDDAVSEGPEGRAFSAGRARRPLRSEDTVA